jgi:hypothetical protein
MREPKLHEKMQRCRTILSNQEITREGPGTILKDVEIVLAAIGHGVVCGGKNANLPPTMLPWLNAHMSDPIELKLASSANGSLWPG